MIAYTVEVDNVRKRFNGVVALRGLSLKVERGITYGLLGPNGAGKTTLIRAMVGLVRPDSGQVTVLGSKMPNKHVLQRIGYMTQSLALYEDLTVRQNLEFFASLFGLHQRREIDDIIALVDLSERADSPVRTLSGGMKQRCSLGCALVHRPELLLLDEPTVGVDPQLRAQFWAYFRQLNRQGVTMILSSHVMDEAERCDRLGFIRDGLLLAEGSSAELRARSGQSTLEDAFLHFTAQQSPVS
jgi:ABC-2 type transport system ATP-binding protein